LEDEVDLGVMIETVRLLWVVPKYAESSFNSFIDTVAAV